LGVDEDHEPITTCVVEWSPVTVAPPFEAAKGHKWPTSATLFRAALITALQIHGTDVKPFPEGAAVRAVALDKVHEEFDRRCPLDGDDREKALARRRQVFARSRKKAEEVGLIGGREIEGTFMVWLVNPDQGSRGSDDHPKGTPA
jgi:hypothetical protein